METTGIAADPAHEAQVDMITHDFNVVQTKLSMSASGTAEPNAEIHMTINHISGPRPDAIRIWFGPKSGEGTMKSKAGGHDDHWHAHVECPGMITHSDALWIEIEGGDGTRESKAIRMH